MRSAAWCVLGGLLLLVLPAWWDLLAGLLCLFGAGQSFGRARA